jgi:membrane carboxypeptidase/penicillin-binding protein PbpC
LRELDVKYAPFGPTIYGVCAAGWYSFDSPSQELSAAEAVQLVGLSRACPARTYADHRTAPTRLPT